MLKEQFNTMGNNELDKKIDNTLSMANMKLQLGAC